MKRRVDVFTTVGFLTVIFAFLILFLLSPDRTFSERENRSLRTLPIFTLSKLTSGVYAVEMNDYFADQFPFRDFWVGEKGGAELLLGKGENNGVLLGSNGQLARRLFDARLASGETRTDTDVFDPSHLRASMEGIRRAGEAIDVPFSVLFTGRTIDVASSSFSYPTDFSDLLYQGVLDFSAGDVDVIDTISFFKECHQNGESVYYKTDHHWTTRGAYYAYCEVMRSFGMENEILPQSYFTPTVVSKSFYGSAWSRAGMSFVLPDEMELWLAEDEGDYEIVADGKVLDGFYQYDHLTKKDQYSVFLDGVHDVVTVKRRDSAARPTLLLLKDSFANSLAPFLARHFDLVLLNLSSSRNDYTELSCFVKLYGADRALLVYTLENVITDDRLCRLN